MPKKEKLIHINLDGKLYGIPEGILKKYELQVVEGRLVFYNSALKTLRESLGLNQGEFGSKVGIAACNISSIESGKRNLGINLARRIAKAFNIDYRELL